MAEDEKKFTTVSAPSEKPKCKRYPRRPTTEY